MGSSSLIFGVKKKMFETHHLATIGFDEFIPCGIQGGDLKKPKIARTSRSSPSNPRYRWPIFEIGVGGRAGVVS